MSALPNIPDEDLVGGDKKNNEVVSKCGEQPRFAFQFQEHTVLATNLGLIDYERGVKLSGQGNWVYTGLGAQMEFAMLSFFINEHIKDGWQFVLIPHMLKFECGFTAGQFPKFQDEVYWIEEKDSSDKKFMLPTAETGLVNLHRAETLSAEDLPKRYFSYTPCFRREAGSSRKEERGTVRGHQFNKIELVQFTTKDDSERAFAEMLFKGETLMKKLGLHYQVSKLAAGDCSASMCRTYDIEVWIPSMGIYKEVSSVSSARDYQSRRGNMRYIDSSTGEKEFIHTLNASGLATSRLFPAILEQYQQEDGSIVVPEVLRPYMGNVEKIDNKHLVKERKR
jgi:seryl-tRNA synthetase